MATKKSERAEAWNALRARLQRRLASRDEPSAAGIGEIDDAFLALVGIPFMDARKGAPDPRFLSMAHEVFRLLVRHAAAEATALQHPPEEIAPDARRHHQEAIHGLYEELHSVSQRQRELVWLVDAAIDQSEQVGDPGEFIRNQAAHFIDDAFQKLDLALVQGELHAARTRNKGSHAIAATLARSVGIDVSKGAIKKAFKARRFSGRPLKKLRP